MTATEAPPAPKPLLELETLAPIARPFITIDGTRYDYMVPGDFGLLELNRLDVVTKRINDMKAAGESLSDDQATELSELLRTVVVQVLRAPAGVIDGLSDFQRFAVLTTFSTASPSAAAKPNRAARRRTGAISSRGSRASTATRTG